MGFDIDSYISRNRTLVDSTLKGLLPEGGPRRTRLREAMRYSALAGGKRLRPVLMIAASEAVGGDAARVLPVACALEMIHTYSLIHDDLPSMDNDPLRRGIPTSHKVFGEATAILAGDALLTDAFYIMVTRGTEAGIAPGLLCEIIGDISAAAGSAGMIEGQALDLALEGGKDATIPEIEAMHRLKTGAMIRVSVTTGAKIGGADGKSLGRLASYADNLGLAFQIRDDLLDLDGSRDTGKEKGNDARRGKSTYPETAGVEESSRKVLELVGKAVSELSDFGSGAEPLRQIALYLGGVESR